MQFWTTEQRGAVAIATFSNPPRNYVVAPVIDELERLIELWRDPSIRALVIQSRPEDAGFLTQYSVEELYGLASDPASPRYSAAIVRRYKADFDRMQALPKVIVAALNGDTMGGAFELTLARDLRIGQKGEFRYGNPKVRAGVIPGAGGTQHLASRIGAARAAEMVFTAAILPPEKLASWGVSAG